MSILNFLNLILPLSIVLLNGACSSFPRDPENTLTKIENDIMKVGITHHPPFTIVESDTSFSGSEVTLVRLFAGGLNSEIEWTHLTEGELFKKLENHEIHLVIGGISQKSPWKKHAGFTVPYFKSGEEKYIMAVPPGENALLTKLDSFLIYHKKF